MGVLQKFRTAVGGFNRRDVLNYIEAEDRAHREQVAGLKKELEAVAAERQVLESKLVGIRYEHGAVAAEEAKVRASLEESTETLARVRGELSQAETKLAVARNELSRLQTEVEQLGPMAKNYEELKERVATVELDAHRKAQATIDEANAQVARLKEETRAWLDRVLGEYDKMRAAVDEQVNAISAMSGAIRESGEAADRLREWGREE